MMNIRMHREASAMLLIRVFCKYCKYFARVSVLRPNATPPLFLAYDKYIPLVQPILFKNSWANKNFYLVFVAILQLVGPQNFYME